MSTSVHVIGIVPADAKWKAMKAVWDSCKSAGVEVPQDVQRFFNWTEPEEDGMVLAIEDTPCVRAWSAEMQDGYEVDVAKLPPNVKTIRFYVGY